MIRIPMLVPGLEYNFETIVECVSDLGISDQLYVFITKDKVPIFTILLIYLVVFLVSIWPLINKHERESTT